MFTVHKPEYGTASRVAAFALFLVAGFYMGYCWYHWQSFSPMAGWIGSAALLLLMVFWGFRVVFHAERSSEFLIEMNDELSKVKWPSTLPLFDSKTEAWGSTYVVIACTIVFTVLIAVLDVVLHVVVQRLLIHGWLMPPAF